MVDQFWDEVKELPLETGLNDSLNKSALNAERKTLRAEEIKKQKKNFLTMVSKGNLKGVEEALQQGMPPVFGKWKLEPIDLRRKNLANWDNAHLEDSGYDWSEKIVGLRAFQELADRTFTEPMHIALAHGDVGMVKLLYHYGAPLTIIKRLSSYEIADALDFAIINESLDLLNFLKDESFPVFNHQERVMSFASSEKMLNWWLEQGKSIGPDENWDEECCFDSWTEWLPEHVDSPMFNPVHAEFKKFYLTYTKANGYVNEESLGESKRMAIEQCFSTDDVKKMHALIKASWAPSEKYFKEETYLNGLGEELELSLFWSAVHRKALKCMDLMWKSKSIQKIVKEEMKELKSKLFYEIPLSIPVMEKLLEIGFDFHQENADTEGLYAAPLHGGNFLHMHAEDLNQEVVRWAIQKDPQWIFTLDNKGESPLARRARLCSSKNADLEPFALKLVLKKSVGRASPKKKSTPLKKRL